MAAPCKQIKWPVVSWAAEPQGQRKFHVHRDARWSSWPDVGSGVRDHDARPRAVRSGKATLGLGTAWSPAEPAGDGTIRPAGTCAWGGGVGMEHRCGKPSTSGTGSPLCPQGFGGPIQSRGDHPSRDAPQGPSVIWLRLEPSRSAISPQKLPHAPPPGPSLMPQGSCREGPLAPPGMQGGGRAPASCSGMGGAWRG